MQAVSHTTKRPRTHHRQPIRTLTYVTLDEANGGIVRDFNHNGLAVQAVAPLRIGQQVRVRFELRQPKLRVEARGEVMWANSSGQSGIRFLDLAPKMIRQVNEWILGNLLESISQHSVRTGGLFGISSGAVGSVREADGLLVSPTARDVIRLDNQGTANAFPPRASADSTANPFDLDWLSRPLSGKKLAWTIDSLIVFAAMLLFSTVFLSVSDDLPQWPMNLAAGAGAAIFVAAFYWGFFHVLAGTTLGASLARLTESDLDGEGEAEKSRFR